MKLPRSDDVMYAVFLTSCATILLLGFITDGKIFQKDLGKLFPEIGRWSDFILGE